MSAPKSAAAAVVFDRVSRHYGPVKAVDEVSFRVEPGTLVTLLGPSGCGKTTTLRMIAGLEFATAGNIRIGERDVTRVSASERDVSMVFQSYALFPHMTVLENVSYGLVPSGLSKKDVAARAREGLKQVGLEVYDERLPSELSGGQQQRVAVARALVLEPQVLLFDEPLSNLDAKLRRHMREEIRDLQQTLGLTAVYVTHDQEEAMAVSDRIVVMDKGRIAQEGAPRELYETPAGRFIADFIGGANLIEAEVAAVADGRATVRVGGATLALPAHGVTPGPAALAARYHALRLVDPGTPGTLAAEVKKATWLGAAVEYRLATAHGELLAVEDDSGTMRRPGESVGVAFRNRGLALVR